MQAATLQAPEEGMAAAIDILIDYTIKNRRFIRYLTERPQHIRTFDDNSGLHATLLAMATVHIGHHRERYRSDMTPRSLAWMFYNMAVATTLRYIDSDDPIPLEDLRRGLKFAATGLLAVRQSPL